MADKKLDPTRLPYWRTSRASMTNWLDKAQELLRKLGSTQFARGMVQVNDTACIHMAWAFNGESYRIAWPILLTTNGSREDSERQAATFIFHWVKAQSLAATVLGVRAAFSMNAVLSDKTTVMETVGRVPMNNLLRLTAQ